MKTLLRFGVTLLNLPLLLLAAAFFTDRFEGKEHLIGVALGGLAILNIVIAWRGRPSAQEPFSHAYVLCRGIGWFFNLFLLLVIGVMTGMAGYMQALWAAAPVAAGLVALVLTRQPIAAPAKPDLSADAPASVIAPVSLAEYYARHKTAVDKTQADFDALLIDQYGFQPDYVRLHPARSAENAEIPAAAAWHRDGKDIAKEADAYFNVFYFSPDANNPAVFARHVETGEPLSPDFDYNDWRDKFLGRSADIKIFTLTLLFLGAAAVYGFYLDAYLPSPAWRDTSVAIALVLCVMLGINIEKRRRMGRFRQQPGKRVLKKRDMIWAVPFGAVLVWGAVYIGIGSVGNYMLGTPAQKELAYKKSSRKACLQIEAGEALAFARYCLPRNAYNALPTQGILMFSGHASWFGMSADQHHAPFGARRL